MGSSYDNWLASPWDNMTSDWSEVAPFDKILDACDWLSDEALIVHYDEFGKIFAEEVEKFTVETFGYGSNDDKFWLNKEMVMAHIKANADKISANIEERCSHE